MNEIFLLVACLGALSVVLGIPLYLQKIKPNYIYGYRTRRTLSDERIWYAANKYFAKLFIISGIVTTSASLILFLIAANIDIIIANLLLVLIVALPLAVSIIMTERYIRGLK